MNARHHEAIEQAVDAAVLAANGERTNLPLSSLFRSKYNVRKVPRTADQQAQLTAQLRAAGGVLENLIVYPEKKKGKETGRFGVAAGGGRYTGSMELVAAKVWPADKPMPCLIVSEAVAIEVSLMENTSQAPMHPADQFDAFLALVNEGRDIAHIAAIFGIGEVGVLRRLKLAKLAPSFLTMFREDQIGLAVLEALTLADDHKTQEEVWARLPEWDRKNPAAIRNAIMHGKINMARHPVAVFVGMDAFEQAGGVIERDIFDPKACGYTTDVDLLNRLATEKLEAAAAPFQAEGTPWAWVEIVPRLDYGTLAQYGQAKMSQRDMTDEETKTLADLQTKYDAISERAQAMEEEGDESEEAEAVYAEASRLDDQLDAFKETLKVPAKSQRKVAGVLVGINDQGELVVKVGRIKPEDMKAAAEAAKQKAKAKSPAAGGEEEAPARPKHSDRLTRQLTGQRTGAVQVAVANNWRVGLNALAARMVEQIMGHYSFEQRVVGITINAPNISGAVGDEIAATDPALVEMAKRLDGWKEKLGVGTNEDNAAAIYDAVAALSLDDLHALLAFCTACSIDTIKQRDDGKEPSLVPALMKATKLDMADFWTPTATNYLAGVPKARVLEIVSGAVSSGAASEIAKMKKGDLVASAEKLLDGRRWVPELFKVAA